MLIGCIFCHYVHSAKGTLNTHLNRFVPEMALARGITLEQDAQHHVGMIRELRWVERGRQEHKITWKLSSSGDERVVLQAFSGLIYHPVPEYAKDDFKCRQFRNVDTAFWRREVRETLAEYRLQPLATRRWFLESAVQNALERALSLAAMRVPAAPPVHGISKAGDNIQTAIGVGRDATQNNPIQGSFNYAAARKKPARVESDSEADGDLPKATHQKPPTQRYAVPESSEDEEPMPAGRKRRPAPAIPESPETPAPATRKSSTGKSASFYASLPTRTSRGRVTHASTTRSPSVFASPSRGRTRPAYTSIADWNTPLPVQHPASDCDSSPPATKRFRPRFTPAPIRQPPALLASPAIEPLLKLTVSVFGCHKAALRIYPGIALRAVIDRAFADAPEGVAGLSAASGIRGAGGGPVEGWKKVWSEEMWGRVLDAARECVTAPEWRAEVVFLGK